MRTEYESKAWEIAEKAHEGQVRKFTALPYIVHPRTVSTTVEVIHLTHQRGQEKTEFILRLMPEEREVR